MILESRRDGRALPPSVRAVRDELYWMLFRALRSLREAVVVGGGVTYPTLHVV